MAEQTSHLNDATRAPGTSKAGVATLAGLLAAIGASSCCIVPLLLFSLGVSGAWIGNLTALEPYKPVFILIALGLLGYGYWQVFRPKPACDADEVCARPLPNYLVLTGLVLATILVLVSFFWPWIVPLILA
ncbi:mercuric transport protein (plasmid) [Maritalea myrionectae]|uniref:Mercuric transport protein MerT n=1 Tax=Maritalea myrionectae TaxID=454601 RepID=A0A2R4MJL6_9HYPH|nr:mercuric transporter MerT family protein [Maritalea myrionectae]AVX06165.1 mercuric transport protein [Maritalea myrionectae]